MPLITFDVGGVGEMLEYSDHPDIIVMDASAKSLSKKLQGEPACSCLPKLSQALRWTLPVQKRQRWSMASNACLSVYRAQKMRYGEQRMLPEIPAGTIGDDRTHSCLGP